MIVTSTDGVEGRAIVEYRGIVSGEAVMGTAMLVLTRPKQTATSQPNRSTVRVSGRSRTPHAEGLHSPC